MQNVFLSLCSAQFTLSIMIMGNEQSSGAEGGLAGNLNYSRTGASAPPIASVPANAPEKTWTWHQKTGVLCTPDNTCSKPNPSYSGAGKGKNNPAMEAVKNVGPIPKGIYEIGKLGSSTVGPAAMKLEPSGNQNMFGRSQFAIHGDSKKDPGNGSKGCIILPRDVREEIAKSGVKKLEVKE